MKILIFGDSITWGSDDREKGGWVERLKMHYFGDERDVDVYNLGIAGDTSDKLLQRFETEIKMRSRKLGGVVLAIGINDSQLVHGKTLVSIETFESNVRELIKQARVQTKIIAVIGLTDVDESKTTPTSWDVMYTTESVRLFNEVLEKVSTEVAFVGVQGKLMIDDLPDGIHPNATGHQKMFELILPTIENFVSGKNAN